MTKESFVKHVAKSRGKSMKLGGGGRFAKLSSKLSHQAGVTDPDALAASIGRKKYGASRMAGWAAR